MKAFRHHLTMGAAAVAAALFVCAPAFAHDTVVMAPDQPAAVGQSLRLSIFSTGEWPKPESAPSAARIRAMHAAIEGETQRLSIEAGGTSSLDVTVTPGRPGLLVAAVAFAPRDIEVGADELDHYLDEIGASAAVRASVASLTEAGVMRETFTKTAKAWVCVQTCGDETRPAEPAALNFYRVSGRTFELVARGEALPGQSVVLVSAAGRRMLATDAEGRVVLPEGLSGRLMLSAVVLKPPAAAGGQFESEWTTLTLDADLLARP